MITPLSKIPMQEQFFKLAKTLTWRLSVGISNLLIGMLKLSILVLLKISPYVDALMTLVLALYDSLLSIYGLILECV